MLVLGALTASVAAQTINLWRGGETGADWSDPYKWTLQHVPAGNEAVHFRQANSVITVNSTIELDNCMMLYGQDLFLEGNGNIKLWSPIPHKSTINIPASATGQANLTIHDALALNGRVALAAKAFGTSASKGSVTLKDRSTIAGILSIGNNGCGSGQVFIRDQSIYRISGLELHTLAENGGAAEIHILGGTAHFEAEAHPFEAFLLDTSRKIIMGESGKLRIDSDWPIERKKAILAEMISKKHIVAASGCKLTSPVLQEDMILLKAEFAAEPQTLETLLADIEGLHPNQDANSGKAEIAEIQQIAKSASPTNILGKAPPKANSSKLKSLLDNMRTEEQAELYVATPATTPNEKTPKKPSDGKPVPLAGYIVFLSAILFFLRPAKCHDEG